MPDDVRIGVEPPPLPPPRSSRVLILAAGLVLLAGAGAWLAGVFRGEATTTAATSPTTSTTAGSATTLPLDARLAAARLFWTALGAGDAAAAADAFPATAPAAADLMGFVAAFRPGFTVGECAEFSGDAVRCSVAVTNGDLLTIGTGTAAESLLVSDDGWFDIPAVLGSSAARLSLYALEAHTAEVHAACPVTDNPQVPRLAIVGSATGACGAYLTGLIPEYLSVLGFTFGPRD